MSMSKEDMKEYWTKFLGVLEKKGVSLTTRNKNLYRSSIGFCVGETRVKPRGETGVKLFSVIDIRRGRDPKNIRIRAEINFQGNDAKELYEMFEEERTSIERELGFRLDWPKKPEKEGAKHYRIAIHKERVNPENRMDWSNQHEWLIEHLCKMHPVVGKYVGKFRG